MFQLRSNIFETNSSSIHTFCVSKEHRDYSYLKGKKVYIGTGEYGWHGSCCDALSYLYTALQYDEDKVMELDEKLKNFGVIPIYLNGCLKHGEYNEDDITGYVDHAGCFYEIWDELVKNNDIFMNFIFGPDTAIYLSSDNSDIMIEEDDCNFPLTQYRKNEKKYAYYEKWN